MYELLTGTTPFRQEDTAEILYSHIAKQPRSPCEVNSKIPLAISNLVMKLINKEADERYQSAAGIIYDIDAFLSILERGEAIPADFPVAQMDAKGTFRIPEKLYGRENETEILFNCFFDSLAGKPNLLTVAGHSGVGKTALVNEIKVQLLKSKGELGSGKFQEHSRSTPYLAIIAAFDGLFNDILAKPDELQQTYKDEILQALTGEGAVLTELIPSLEFIIGQQQSVAALEGASRLSRLQKVFSRLLGGIATFNHPLVLFLDDLQWADLDSLKLLEYMLSENTLTNILVIFSYRSNEVDPKHPFALTLGLIEQRSAITKTAIALENILVDDINQMMSDTFDRPIEQTRELAEMLFKKTRGSPFFLSQMLSSLNRKGFCHFDQKQGWSWNIDVLHDAEMSSDVIEFMVRQLNKYSPEIRDLMNFCALSGTTSVHYILQMVTGTNYLDIVERLNPVFADGLMFERKNNSLCFVHDKILEASYGIKAEAERTARHFKFAVVMLQHYREKPNAFNPFAIAEHFNLGAAFIETHDLKMDAVKINLEAARRAQQSASFDSATEFYEKAYALFKEQLWEIDYDLAFEVCSNVGFCAFSANQRDKSEEFLRLCLAKESNSIRRNLVTAYLLKILFMAQRHGEAIDLGLSQLRALGFHINPHPNKVHVIAEYLTWRLALGFRSNDQILKIPECKDARVLAIKHILVEMGPSTYMIRFNLLGVMLCQVCKLCLQHGHSVYSSFGFCGVALIEIGVFKMFKRADTMFDLSWTLSERFPDKVMSASLYHLEMTWRLPNLRAIATLPVEQDKSCVLNTESGNNHWADYAYVMSNPGRIFDSGSTLVELFQQYREIDLFHTKKNDHDTVMNSIFILRWLYRQLGLDQGLPEAAETTLTALRKTRKHTMNAATPRETSKNVRPIEEIAHFDEVRWADEIDKPDGNLPVKATLYVFKQVDAFLNREYAKVLDLGIKFMIPIIDLIGINHEIYLRFYFSLAYLCNKGGKGLRSWKRLVAPIYHRMNYLIMWWWAKHNPVSWGSYYHTLLAVKEMNRGNTASAYRNFDIAIEMSGSATFVRAIALELYGEWCLRSGHHVHARMFLKRAFETYLQHGLKAQADRISGLHYDLIGRGQGDTGDTTTRTTTIGADSNVDMKTLIDGSQIISQSVKINDLVDALLNILIKSAGGQRCFILLNESGTLVIQGEAVLNAGEVQKLTMHHEEFPCPKLSSHIVSHVSRTHKDVILEDAMNRGQFRSAPYIGKNGIKSVACIALTLQGELKGVLYLENNMVANAFTESNVKFLKVLSTQAAISIDNAQIYANLEQKVELRTLQLAQKNREIQTMLQTMKQGIFMIELSQAVCPEYSRYLEAILETKNIVGRKGLDLLFENSNLGTDILDSVKSAVNGSMGEQVLTFQVNHHLLLTEFKKAMPDGKTIKTLELSWDPILDDSEMVERLMITVRDVTELRALQEQAAKQSDDLAMISHILGARPGYFLQFLESSKKYLGESRSILTTHKTVSAEQRSTFIKTLFRNMHTIKGNARNLAMTKMTDVAHEGEASLAEAMRNPESTWEPNRLLTELALVESALNRYEFIYVSKLAQFAEKNERQDPSVPQDLLDYLVSSSRRSSDFATCVDTFVAGLESLRIAEVLTEILQGLPQIAGTLDKESPHVKIEDHNIRVGKECANMLRDVFMHMFRNSMDHGIETRPVRESKGKDPVGTITLTLKLDRTSLDIHLHDDGQGLNLKALRTKGQSLQRRITDDRDVAELIFESGISTAATLSDISGRGVGMDAVRAFLQEQGGGIRIAFLGPELETGFRSFEFVISLPARLGLALGLDAVVEQRKAG